MILFTKFPLEESLGGAEEHTLALAKSFKQNQKDIKLITSDKKLFKLFKQNRLPADYLWLGWEPTSKWSLFLWPLTYFIAKYKLKKILSSNRSIEAVFMQSLTEKLILPEIKTSHSRKKERLFFLEHKIPGRWLRLSPLKHKYLHLSNQVFLITVSNYAKKQFIKLGVKEANIKVIYPGVSMSSTPTSKPDVFTVGIISRLHPEKGVLEFIKTITPTLKNHANWKIIIAGDGRETPHINKFIHDNALQRQVSILGWVEDKDNFFSQVSVVCYPSKSPESFGLVIAEAQSYAVPVITSNSGALPEIVSGGGLIVKNKEEWAEKLTTLSNNAAFYKNLCFSAKKNSRRFSKKKMEDAFLELLP